MESSNFLSASNKIDKLAHMIESSKIIATEYYPEKDTLIVYDSHMEELRSIPDFLQYVEKKSHIHPQDRWIVIQAYRNQQACLHHVRAEADDQKLLLLFTLTPYTNPQTGEFSLLATIRDISAEASRNILLEKRATYDPLTDLYNSYHGKKLIKEYLQYKDPYESCGLVIVDVDHFKQVNDTQGHLFGDTILLNVACTLKSTFERKDIVMRAGGDEFVVLVKNINMYDLTHKIHELIKNVSQLHFEENSYSVTCSAGVCFLPGNENTLSYEQLFKNADMALYQAKEQGRNRCVFCDSLNRYEKSMQANYDQLTGILSYYHFREELNRILAAHPAMDYVMVYTDFIDFRHFNKKYGYQIGDKIIKEFTSYISSHILNPDYALFTRVVADKFILLTPFNWNEHVEQDVDERNKQFLNHIKQVYPDVELHIRSGICRIDSSYTCASEAIDAADEARLQISVGDSVTAKIYVKNDN